MDQSAAALRVESGRPSTGAAREEPPPVQRRLRLLLGLLLFGAGLWTIRTFLPALAWAAVLAVATWPLYRRARRRFPPAGHDVVWPAVFTAAVALLFLVPLAAAGIEIAREARHAFGLLDEAKRTGLPTPEWLARLPAVGAAAAGWWNENLAAPGAASGFLERIDHDALTGYTRSLGGQLLHRSVIFGFTILTLFFLYRDGAWLVGKLLVASERAIGPHGERIGRQMMSSVHGTVDGLVLVGLGEGAIMGVVYYVAGVPHAILFGAATAIAAMIPFGAALLYGSAALVVLAGGSVGWAVGIMVIGTAVVFVADHAVRPALIGGATKLPFVWVLLGILGGVETFNLVGLFLGPAIMAALHLLWRDWTEPKPQGADIRAETAAPPAR